MFSSTLKCCGETLNHFLKEVNSDKKEKYKKEKWVRNLHFSSYTELHFTNCVTVSTIQQLLTGTSAI